jgi:stage II sporulation protein M
MTLVIIAGVACGALLVRFLDEGPLQEITVTLNRFFTDLKEEENNLLASPELLRASYFRNGALLLLMWVLGFFSVGFAMVPIVLFLKGLSLGFTVGMVIYRYSLKGFLFCLAAVLPHNLFFVPAYVMAGSFAFAYSLYLYKNRLPHLRLKKNPFIIQYCFFMVAASFIALIGGLMEAYITPVFIRLVLPIL